MPQKRKLVEMVSDDNDDLDKLDEEFHENDSDDNMSNGTSSSSSTHDPSDPRMALLSKRLKPLFNNATSMGYPRGMEMEHGSPWAWELIMPGSAPRITNFSWSVLATTPRASSSSSLPSYSIIDHSVSAPVPGLELTAKWAELVPKSVSPTLPPKKRARQTIFEPAQYLPSSGSSYQPFSQQKIVRYSRRIDQIKEQARKATTDIFLLDIIFSPQNRQDQATSGGETS